MKLTNMFKGLIAVVMVLVTTVVIAQAAEAIVIGNQNVIGGGYQWVSMWQGGYSAWPETQRTQSGIYAPYTWRYNYISQPRAGGTFGASTNYLVGLRKPYYPITQPTLYTDFYKPYCSWPCTFGGYWGYPNYGNNPYSGTYRIRY